MEVMKVYCALLLVLWMLPAAAQKQEKDVTGQIPLAQFWKDETLKKWFVEEYNDYEPDAEAIGKLKSHLAGKKIIVVLGTWCSDSEREFPRLMKVLDAVRFPKEYVTVWGVNEAKTVPKNIIEKYNVEFVPTIIITGKEGKELGRIVEEAEESIEEDLLEIK